MVREEGSLNSCQGEWEGEQTSEGRIAGSTKVPPEVRGQGFRSDQSAGSAVFFAHSQLLSRRCKKVGFHHD